MATTKRRKTTSPRKSVKGRSKRGVRKNPVTTKEGRVLVARHGKRRAAKLLAARAEAKRKHQRKPRRDGTLTYQSAEYILRYGRSSKAKGRAAGSRKSSKPATPVRPRRSGRPLSGAFNALTALGDVQDFMIGE